MIIWTCDQIKSALGQQLIKPPANSSFKVSQVVIDSRKKTNNGLFIAIVGENNDGHNFLNQAFENGSVLSLVEKIPVGFENDPRLVLVKSTVESLSKLAIFSRSRTKAKIMAVTGSVGKTSVKEMLKIAFATQGKVFASEGNLNNHFGLPLSLANLPSDFDYGIFEMGMNHLGEIKPLSEIAKPHIAIVTNVCPAHIGNFSSEDEIALAKSEIFSGVASGGYAIINNDNKYFEYLRSRAISAGVNVKNVISFGAKETSNIRLFMVENLEKDRLKVDVKINDFKQPISYIINTVNQSVIFNSLIVVACLKLIGRDISSGLAKLESLKVPSGRGDLIKVNNKGLSITIIDDSYNANPASMFSGIRFLSDLKSNYPGARTVAVIGDMFELGKFALDAHKKVADYLIEDRIDKVILVGELMKSLLPILGQDRVIGYFDDSKKAAEEITNYLQNHDLILVKGSRGMAMEKIIKKIQE